MSSTYSLVVLAKRPKDEIVPGTFAIQTKPVPKEADLKNGEVLLESLYLSLDPAMRGWLNGITLFLELQCPQRR
jgi:NADPH-dependent curcumin reductase CurA